jgi:hypothetical protein
LALFGAANAQSYAPYEQHAPNLPAADVGDYGAIRTVTLISVLGPEIHVGTRDGSQRTVDISAWKADELVVTTLRRYLASRFHFVDAAVDGAGLRAVPEFLRESRTLDLLKTQPGTNADAYVIVRPADGPGPAGMGLHVATGVSLCANFEIDVIDARRWTYLGKAYSRMQTHAGTPASHACYAQDVSTMPDLLRGPGTDAMDRLHTQALALLPRSLVETLRALKLGLALPPPGDHSIAPPENEVSTDGIASVAVVSAFADSFSFSTPRDALHHAELVQTPVDEWKLDQDVEQIARAALTRKFAVRHAELDRAVLARIVLREGVRPKIEGLVPSAEVDAYVLILKAFRAGTGSSGPGLWNQDWMGRSTYAYANYAIVLVDARTLKVLKAALPLMAPRSNVAFPLVRVDGSLWPDGAKDRSAAGRAEAVIRTLMAESVAETLYQMGLTKDGE